MTGPAAGRKGLTLFIFALFILYFAVNLGINFTYGHASDKWQTGEGIVTATDAELQWFRKSSHYHPVVHYKYSVNGKEYTSSRVSFPEPDKDSHQKALLFLNDFPVGGKVPVYYDAGNPSNVCLEKGFDERELWTDGGFIVLMLFLSVIVAVFRRS